MQISHREEFLVLWKLFTVAILPLETQFIQPNYLVILSHLRSTTGSLETNSYIPFSKCPSPTLFNPPFSGDLVSQTENSKITVGSLLAKLSYWAFLGQVCINLREKKDILSPVSHFFTSTLQSTVRKKIYESIICMFILSPWRPYLFSTYFDYVKNL